MWKELFIKLVVVPAGVYGAAAFLDVQQYQYQIWLTIPFRMGLLDPSRF